MRAGLLLTGFILCLPASVLAQPESVLYVANVSQASAPVRCLPSEAPAAYITQVMPRGTNVQVVGEEGNGWLRIVPPQGSFSWVSKRFVEQPTQNNPNWVVKAARDVKVPVVVGSDQAEFQQKRPTTVRATLQRGALVVAVGQVEVDAEDAWLPIVPPLGEYRYIRAEAVTRVEGQVPAGPAGPSPFRAARPETMVGGSSAPGNAPALNVPGLPGPTAGTPRVGSTKVDQLWAQAVQAERSGNVPEAILLYIQVGTEGATANHDLAMQALNRAHWLRQSGRNQTVQGLPTRPATPQQPDPGPVAPAPGTTTGGTGSRFTPAGTSGSEKADPLMGLGKTGTPAGTPAGTVSRTPTRPSSEGGHPWTTPLGILRTTGQLMERRRLYLLVTRDERPISYVIAGHGVDLEAYVNREVELAGMGVYRNDWKTNLLVAERVQPGR